MKTRDSIMTRLARFIVKAHWLFLLLFLAAIVFSVFSLRWVHVENDVTAYLPDDAEAKRGLSIMDEEFTTFGTARVMVKDISYDQAKRLAKQLGEVENVVLVSFDESASHYNNGHALFTLTFGAEANDERSIRALDEVKEIVSGMDTVIHSDVGFTLAAGVAEQMAIVSIFVVIVVLAVLVFTSSTYAEIPVMVLTFLTAAIINLGTHFLMGTISFVSNSVAIVLQLALSVDYAIIFCNRYKEEHKTLEIKDAVTKALAASIPEIFASSLTTIAGLTAMTFMKFRLGVDMGLTLIKAILCSLLTVFLFMPSLLVIFGKAMDKTRHKNFVPKISFVGKLAYKTRFIFPLLFLILVSGAYVVFRHVNYAYAQDLVPAFRMTERETADAEINANFGKSNIVAVMVPSGNYPAEKALVNELAACPEVKSALGIASVEAVDGFCIGDEVDPAEFARIAGIDETTAQAVFAYYAAEVGDHWEAREDISSYKASLLDLFLFLHDRVEAGDVELEESQTAMILELFDQLSMVRSQMMSDNYSRLVLDLNLPAQSEETFRFLDQIHHMAAQYYDSGVVLTGDSVSALGFRDSFASDNTIVGLMSLVLVMLILFFTFKSFGMPLLLILVIQGSIWINFAIAALKGDYVFFLCYLIVSAIQMGANIDYAIVVSSRYRELRETMDKREAIIETLNLAFPTVITSGLMMVCAGLLIGFGVSQCIIAGMGYYVGTGTSISLILILFALPQVLLLGDQFVSATTLRTENSGFLAFLSRNKARIGGVLLGAAMMFALVAAPLGLLQGRELSKQSEERVEGLLERTGELRKLAEKLERDGANMDSLKYGFAEQLMTDEVGSVQLAEGEEKLREGESQFASGYAMYSEGAAQLADAEAQYQEGAAKLAAAQAQYDAGLAAYNSGKAQYDAAKDELATGQAQYDAGLAAYNEGRAAYEEGQRQLAEGQAAYDAGLAQYNEAKSALDTIAPLYNTALGLQQRVNDAQAQYDAAVASGDLVQAMLLAAEVTAAQAAFDAQLGGTSINSLMAQYEAANAQLAAAEQELNAGKQKLDEGYAQAAAAEQQLAAAEQQLNEGKQKLDDGYAQLAVADQQLSAAEQQLSEGKTALDQGYAQLDEGGNQIAAGKGQLNDAYQQLMEGGNELAKGREKLEEGREMLEENLEALNGSLSALDQYSDEMERLEQGLRLLKEEKGIKEQLTRNPGPLEVIDTAENYYQDLLDQAKAERRAAQGVALMLVLAVVISGIALILSAFKVTLLPGAIFSAAAGLLSLMAVILWRNRCPMMEGLLPIAALAMTICAALFSEFLFQKRRSLLE